MTKPESSLKFGTSGLRGLADELAGAPAQVYARAFVETMKEDGAPTSVLIARDLRASSPAIARLCADAVAAAGFTAIDGGEAPTPALALAAMASGIPAIMVTGSHIPEDRNGLKFYRPLGEIDKNDEQRILAWHARLEDRFVPPPGTSPRMRDLLAGYRARYASFFDPRALQGVRIGVYQHSSVARDLLCDCLADLGADPVPLGRASRFVPVDTEALRPEDGALLRGWAAERTYDAFVSTDGDADRPLVADGSGTFLRGDLVGAITAATLGADAVVTPVTSNSGVEACRRFPTVLRTRVGSPYVIEGMARAAAAGGRAVVGFEANGGVLLGSSVERAGRRLAALPTRDAMLPILATLVAAATSGQTLDELARSYGFAIALSNRLQNVAATRSATFLQSLQEPCPARAEAFVDFGGVATLDSQDGVRIATGSGAVVHFRASGNAPELRVYVEAKEEPAARALLAFGMAHAERSVR